MHSNEIEWRVDVTGRWTLHKTGATARNPLGHWTKQYEIFETDEGYCMRPFPYGMRGYEPVLLGHIPLEQAKKICEVQFELEQ